MTVAERAWWKSHGQEARQHHGVVRLGRRRRLLADRTTYGAFGDHGGAQKDVQRIPMVFYNPSLKAVRRLRSAPVDLMPTVMKAMGMAATEGAGMDGQAYTLAMK